ncbi:MAG: hypothetical protein F9B45_08170 [Phycisphaera sp. RhM]|nr:hypothetical protein [Phycisphaera sp. RhM]
MRTLISIIGVLAVFAGAAEAQPNSSTELAESRGYTEAAKALLESLHPFDVSVSVEQSIDLGEIIIPESIAKWRMQLDKTSQQCFYAVDVRTIKFDDAVEGRLDNWKSESFVKTIRGKQVTEMRLDKSVKRRSQESFEVGLINERVPDLTSIMHVEIVWAVNNPASAREKILRIYALAGRVISRQVFTDEGPGIDVQAVIEDDKAKEVHRWTYAADTFEPRSYQILQSPAGSSNSHSIYRQTLKWKDDANYGRVPVEARVVEPTMMVLGSKDAGSKKRIECRRYTDITFVWKRHGGKNMEDWGTKQISIQDFDGLFE